MNDKKKRFNELIYEYAKAFHLANQLIDSGVFERKVKIKDFESFRRRLTVSVASDMREAERIKSGYVLDEQDSLALAETYFYELETRGAEWKHADLTDLFTKWRSQLRGQIEDDES